MQKAHFIIYVADQAKSTAFYSFVLGESPRLNVPGMSEFLLAENAVLGLMPKESAARLLGEHFQVGNSSKEITRAEIYLIVDKPANFHERALAAGAVEVSKMSDRDWGHRAAYSLDADGYVLAFAEEII